MTTSTAVVNFKSLLARSSVHSCVDSVSCDGPTGCSFSENRSKQDDVEATTSPLPLSQDRHVSHAECACTGLDGNGSSEGYSSSFLSSLAVRCNSEQIQIHRSSASAECSSSSASSANVSNHGNAGTDSRLSSASNAGTDSRMSSARNASSYSSSARQDCAGADLLAEANTLDLFHTVAGLYARSFPSTDIDDIYSILAADSTRTILLYTDMETAVMECQKAYKDSSHGTDASDVTTVPGADGDDTDSTTTGDEEEEEEDDDDEPASVLSGVFSDSSSEEEESDEEDDEDQTDGHGCRGQAEFLHRVAVRRNLRHSNKWNCSSVGIESRLAGALTFRWVLHGKLQRPLVHIGLFAIRPRYRGRGLGTNLLQQVKKQSVSGNYSAIICYADERAVDYFKKNDFDDDPVLCMQYIDAIDPWHSSTFMCYISGHYRKDASEDSGDDRHFLVDAESEMSAWKTSQVTAYQQQVALFKRMKCHIQELEDTVSKQQSEIRYLTGKLRAFEESIDTRSAEDARSGRADHAADDDIAIKQLDLLPGLVRKSAGAVSRFWTLDMKGMDMKGKVSTKHNY
eukprot:scpid30480/ scgid7553/ 